MQTSSKCNRLLLLIGIACLLVVMDQASKAIVRTAMIPGSSVPLIDGILRITFVQNFRGFSWWVPTLPAWTKPVFQALLIFIVVAAFPVHAFYSRTRRQSIWTDVAAVGLAASAGGHLVDGFFVPYATDFIQVFHSPSANFADLYSYVGIGALTLEMISTSKLRKPKV